jgi:hypothetical protein
MAPPVGVVQGVWITLLNAAVTLTGCKYYYGKPSAANWNWAEDHTDCLRAVGILNENKQYAMVSSGPYRACMLAKGSQREEKVGAPRVLA